MALRRESKPLPVGVEDSNKPGARENTHTYTHFRPSMEICPASLSNNPEADD
jgi:hypothetical protein